MGYSDSKYQANRTLPFAGITVAGTDAAVVPKFRIRCPKAITVTGATYCLPVGGTSGARSIVIGKSLAGTGAVAAISTIVAGTAVADNTSGVATVTETTFAAGDHLVVQVAAGTSGSAGRMDLAIEWKETFG